MLYLAIFAAAVTQMLASTQPWYHSNQDKRSTFVCGAECSTTMDCDTGLSCFNATSDSKGCCLKALKPNETGCVVNDQCKRACESTHCDLSQTPSRCLCDSGRHFLFNKCWKKCPEFALPAPVIDSKGFSRCDLKMDTKSAMMYMRRMRRQLRSAFC
uniref:TIL domain-containing protein n=1 Tax=Steinernema glaseri TaxID=37863 RepID=A0A1I7YP05_9BILA